MRNPEVAFKRSFTFFLPFFMLLTGLYLFPVSVFNFDFSRIPGDFGDARFNNYILEHDFLYFTGQIRRYWDAPFMFPFQNVIAFSDNLLGAAPVYAIFRYFGSDRETAYQWWLISMFILNFICCYWALKKWSGHTILSSAGAYIFAFSILLVGNIYNVQTCPRFMVPLIFYWTWKYFTTKEIKYFLYLAFGIVYLFYCGIYLGFLLLYALFFFFLAYVIIYRDFLVFKQFMDIRRASLHLLILLFAGLLFYSLIHPYIVIAKDAGIAYFEETRLTIPTLRSYFFTSPAPVLWHFLSEHGKPVLAMWWCHFLFVGALPWLAIALYPLVLRNKHIEKEKKKFITFLALSFLLCFVFCLNIEGYSLYVLFYKIPGFSAMRSMNRIINIEILFFILLLVFIFKELSSMNRFMKWLVFCLPVLSVCDNAIFPEAIDCYIKKDSQKAVEIVKQEIQKQYSPDFVAISYVPFYPENTIHLHLNVMLACQELNLFCVNAYTGHNPAAYNNYFNRMDNESLAEWCLFNHINAGIIQKITSGK